MSYSQSNAKRNPLGASLYGATARYIDKETVSTGTSFAFPVDATEIEEEEGERFQRNEQGFSCSNISTDSCGWLDFVTALICIAYSVFLIWLLAHVKDETNYYFLNFVTFFLIVLWSVLPCCYDRRVAVYFQQLRMVGVVAMLMCTFTMLTRTAFYHLKRTQTVGPEFVIMSLKCSIFVFVWAMLARKRFRPIAIKANRHTIVLVILDNADIFNLAETLSQETGLGKSIAEHSPLENAIQVFGTLAFVILWVEASLGKAVDESTKTFKPTMEGVGSNRSIYNIVVQWISLLFHNIPFLVIRIIVWVNYDVYNICFVAKNVMFIIFCVVELRYSALAGHDAGIPR